MSILLNGLFFPSTNVFLMCGAFFAWSRMGTHSRPSWKIINPFIERYAQCPDCRMKFLYNIVAMRRRHRDTWPAFPCPNAPNNDPIIACKGQLVDYEEPIESQEAEDRIKTMLYHNYTSPLVVTATLIGKAGSSS
jgi:hypothetical protein